MVTVGTGFNVPSGLFLTAFARSLVSERPKAPYNAGGSAGSGAETFARVRVSEMEDDRLCRRVDRERSSASLSLA